MTGNTSNMLNAPVSSNSRHVVPKSCDWLDYICTKSCLFFHLPLLDRIIARSNVIQKQGFIQITRSTRSTLIDHGYDCKDSTTRRLFQSNKRNGTIVPAQWVFRLAVVILNLLTWARSVTQAWKFPSRLTRVDASAPFPFSWKLSFFRVETFFLSNPFP